MNDLENSEKNETERDTEVTSRRRFVGTAATGIIGMMAANVLAQQTPPGPQLAMAVQKVNQYPKPPFPVQQQEWPGLASKMTPRPDHGEDSYKGTGRLMNRKALITGGDSGMGRA